MEYTIEGKCRLKLNHRKGDTTSSHVHTDIALGVSQGLDRKQYIEEDGAPTQLGCKALTNAFVQGLVGNIHQAHQKGYWNDAEHIRYVIAELKKGFVAIANTYPSTFD